MALRPGIERISLTRLRASIAVLLDPYDVQAATSGLADDVEIESEAFASAIRSAQWRLMRRRAATFVKRATRLSPEREPEAGERTLPNTDPALMLALHVGTGATTEQLARALGNRHAHVCRDLLNIRLSLLNREEHSCKVFLDELGQHRDSYVDLGLAATISRHRVRCAACHVRLQEFESIDAEIERQVLLNQRDPGVVEPADPPLTRRLLAAAPVAIVVAVLAGAVMFSAGMADSIIGRSGSAIFAEEQTASVGEDGWIIYGTIDGGLQALDPTSGRMRTIHDEYFTAGLQSGANFLISPDDRLVAIFAQNDVPGLHWATREIRIIGIDGDVVNEINWHHSVESGWPTGWLNTEEILIISVPVYEGGESHERFLERLEAEGSLRAVDVTTGEQRTLFDGGVAQVIPSPDGSRLAMVRPRNPAHAGATVDLWELVDGELGELITSIEHQFTWQGGLVWSRESDAVYLGQVSGYDDLRREDSRDEILQSRITEVDVLRLDRDGTVEHVTSAGNDTSYRVIGTGNGGTALYLVRTVTSGEHTDSAVLRHDLETDEVEELNPPAEIAENATHQRTENGVLGYETGFAASPSGSDVLIHFSGDHFLPADPNHHQGGAPEASYLVRVSDADQPDLVTIRSPRWPITPLRWVSSEEISFPQAETIDHARRFSGPERVEEVRSYAQLGQGSSASQDGVALPMVESTDGAYRPYLWFPQVETGRWIAQRTVDLSWLPDGHAMIGVTALGDSGNEASRITLHSASQRGGSSIDAFFDPLGLEDDPSVRYAVPAANPDGSRVSFFAVDELRDRAHLWVAGWDGTLESFDGHSASSRRLRVSPLNAQWISNDSLVYSRVEEWSGGFPLLVTLERMDFSHHGEPETSRLMTVAASGRDEGIAIIEFALHPAGEFFAYRVRHYSDPDDRREGYDTIHLAPASDLEQGLEIRRGDMSNGLTWSPDGNALAIGSDNQIGVYGLDTHDFSIVSGDVRSARHPVWISESELWFNIGRSDDADVYRVRFGD